MLFPAPSKEWHFFAPFHDTHQDIFHWQVLLHQRWPSKGNPNVLSDGQKKRRPGGGDSVALDRKIQSPPAGFAVLRNRNIIQTSSSSGIEVIYMSETGCWCWRSCQPVKPNSRFMTADNSNFKGIKAVYTIETADNLQGKGRMWALAILGHASWYKDLGICDSPYKCIWNISITWFSSLVW